MPFADNVDAQIFFVARLPRAAGGRARRRHARRGGRRLSGAAAQPAGHAVHARRVGGRGARRDARDHVRRDAASRRRRRGQPGGCARRRGDRLRARQRPAPRPVDDRAAARRRHAERVLLGADPVRAVPRRLRRDVPRDALADGRPRRRAAIRRFVRPLPLVLVAFAVLRLAGAPAQPAEPRRGRRRVARRGRRARAARRVLQRVARHRRRRLGRRPDRLRRHHRAAPGAAARRRRITGSCCRRRRSSARRSSSAATSLARTVLAPLELPVGIITALIGGPFFLWLLVRKR